MKEDFNYFFQQMQEYQYAIEREDIKSACSSLCEAMICIGIIKNFFEYLESDMIRLLRGESKTTDFQFHEFSDYS